MGNINFGNNKGNYEGSIFTGDYIGQQNDAIGQQKQAPKEDAGSIAGVMQPPIGYGGYVGGYVGEQQGNSQQAGGYVGGFVGTEQAQSSGYVSNKIEVSENSKALAKPSLWTRFKAFLFQEIDLTQEITIELSAKEEKVLTEIHDFLFQELSFKGFMDILKIGTNRK